MKKFLFSIIMLLCVNIVFAAPGDNEVTRNGVKYKLEKDGSVKAEIAGPNESAGITDIVRKQMLFFYSFSMLEFEEFKEQTLSKIKENLYETIHNTKNTCIDL